MPLGRPHRTVVLLGAACLLGLGALLRHAHGTTGAFAFALDDAYIHLAVSRNLAGSGTWGVNPGEFASASSSPVWTALLALVFLPAGPSLVAPLLLNALALVGVLVAAGRLLADETPRLRAVTLVTLAVATPLPFLAGLGMEHTLHLALVLGLLAGVEQAVRAAATPSPRTLLGLALLAAVAVLTRYETLFLLGGLGLAFGRRAPRAIVATWSGAGIAVAGFGLWSLRHGAAFLPNPVLKKGWTGRDWLGGLREAWMEATALWLLVLAVALALGLGAGVRARQRGLVFLVAAGGQLLFGRVGWLYRYEAWLVGLGVLALLPMLAPPWGRGAWRAPALILALAALPLAHRADRAVRAFAPASRSTFDTNVAPARWLADTFPGLPLAVHDLGAMAFFTRSPLVDLAGLGNDEIARLHRAGRLNPDTLAPLLSARGVEVAITGPTWMDDARPAHFTEVARLVVPHPAFPGTFETVVWANRSERAEELRRALAEPAWASRVEVRLSTDRPVDLGTASLVGPALGVEAEGLCFYQNGSATLPLPEAGALRVMVAGTSGDGRLPAVRFTLGGVTREVLAPKEGVVVPLGHANAGDTLTIQFDDDAIDRFGGDRNVIVRRVTLRP